VLFYSILSDEEQRLETSAIKSLYDGQFTLSTQFIKPTYLQILPIDAAPEFVLETYPLIGVIWRVKPTNVTIVAYRHSAKKNEWVRENNERTVIVTGPAN